MKQVVRRVIDRSGVIRVEEMPWPRMGNRDLLVDARFSVISSGTELGTLRKTLPELARQTLKDPWMRTAVGNIMKQSGLTGTLDRVHDELVAFRTLGYSGAGVVVEAGGAVDRFRIGDRVAYCGQGHAEVVRASVNQCVALPEGLDFRAGAFATVGSIALQGVRRAGVTIGHRVAVIGLGLIGQMTAQLVTAAGARCIGIEPDAGRRQVASELGAELVIDPGETDPVERVLSATEGLGADRVIICASGKDKAIANDALKMSRPHGRVSVVGLVPMELERMPFFVKELDFVFSRAYGPGPFDPDWVAGRSRYPKELVPFSAGGNMESFLALAASGKVKVSQLVGGEFAVDSAQEAYDEVRSGGCLAALLSYAPSRAESRPEKLKVAGGKARRRGTISLGLVGCGNFTRSVLLPALRHLDCSIRILAAASGEHTVPMARKYGIAEVTTEADAVFEDDGVDAVLVTTRHHLHADLVRRALEVGKHVFVEKPLALKASEAIELEETARERGLVLMVGYNRRYAPLTSWLMRQFEAGRPTASRYRVAVRPIPTSHWTLDPVEGGGRLLGESDHFLDLLNRFAGSEPVAVHAISAAGTGETVQKSCTFEVEVRYANGSLGNLLYTDRASSRLPREELEVHSTGTTLRLVDFQLAEVLAARRRRRRGRVEMGHRQELEQFVRLVREGASSDLMRWDLEATLVAQAAFRSIREERPVRLSEFYSSRDGDK